MFVTAGRGLDLKAVAALARNSKGVNRLIVMLTPFTIKFVTLRAALAIA